MAEYDRENIFAKILDNKIPAHKVYETRASLAILDAFPMCEGHVLLLSKHKGATDFLGMPAGRAAEFAADLHKVANAVKKAFNADAVNIWNNSGEESGQTTLHPHFHIMPRFKDDKNGVTYPSSAKEQITKEQATPVVEKLVAILHPPKPLQKPRFQKIAKLNPVATGMNLLVKVLSDPKKIEAEEGKKIEFYEATVGDSSGTVILSLVEAQIAAVKKDAILEVRNCVVKMIKGHIRITVNKWGKVDVSSEEFEGEVNETNNVSEVEYELAAVN